MLYSIDHSTEYEYHDFVSYCQNIAMLKPRETKNQQLLNFSLEIEPKPSDLSEGFDFFGNTLNRFSIHQLHKKLKVVSHSIVSRLPLNIEQEIQESSIFRQSFVEVKEELNVSSMNHLEAKQYILESTLIRKVVPEIKDYALESFTPNRSFFQSCIELMNRIYHDFKFVSGFTNIATPLSVVMKEKKGVCQDFAQIAIACMRSIGMPARYVSGYIETIPPENSEKLVGSDASHAWFSVYLPGYGWIDFDPTNNQIPSEQHVVLAYGRDYYDIPPLKGVIYTNGKNTLKVSVDMQRLSELNP